VLEKCVGEIFVYSSWLHYIHLLNVKLMFCCLNLSVPGHKYYKTQEFVNFRR
jgi:hypothetical protein